MAETDKFVEEIISKLEQNLVVVKVEKDRFRFTGLNVCAVKDGINIFIEYYVMSLEDVTDIRKANHKEELTKLDM